MELGKVLSKLLNYGTRWSFWSIFLSHILVSHWPGIWWTLAIIIIIGVVFWSVKVLWK